MNYSDCINLLTSTSKFQIKLGLDRIKKILSLFGNPQDKIKIIHIAGTNGKGSVCACLANILSKSGYKTGLYTSPHLIEYTERIQINGIQIAKNNFVRLTEEICTTANQNNIDLTEFEILTAMAFKYFYDNKVDFAIIETGLGGRFDATNVCDNPLLSIITSISLDHTDKLGDTIEKISFEKAGIIKKNSSLIVSKLNMGYPYIKNQAHLTGANIITVEKDIEIVFENNINYAIINSKKYEFNLLGLYQKRNLALVVKAVEFLLKNGYKIQMEEGLKTINWHARLEYIKDKNLIIDGAHNPDGAIELKKSLDYYFPNQKRIFIYGTINTKDYLTVAKNLFNSSDEIYYYEFSHKNALSYEEYTKNLALYQLTESSFSHPHPALPPRGGGIGWGAAKKQFSTKVTTKIKRYTPEVLKRKELKILTGSLYMIGEFLYKIASSVTRRNTYL